jgi:UDP-N-acetylglucosamine 2-epimerase (non-hydrolysing)
MKKILTLFGTRPEAIKMGPIIKMALQMPHDFSLVTCVTGQHRKMLDQILDVFNIYPDYDLNVMTNDQTLESLTSRVLTSVHPVLRDCEPDIVLVQGDTTTTFAAALSAFCQQVPLGHVEAGLRTYDLRAPFPEEMNRQLTSRIASYHFAPTERERQNLIEERIPAHRIMVTGNTVIDALFMILGKIRRDSDFEDHVIKKIQNAGLSLSLRGGQGKLILVTGHRRESFGKGFQNICTALKEVASRFSDVDIIYPVHLNPKVRKPVSALLKDLPNVHLIEPVDYEAFVYLMSKAHLIITDSGGVQEEAPSLGKPVLLMREITERPAGVDAGTVKIVGTEPKVIVDCTTRLLMDPEAYKDMIKQYNPYGDGHAAERILDFIQHLPPRRLHS